MPATAEDGFPKGMDGGSLGLASVAEKILTLVGLSELKGFLSW